MKKRKFIGTFGDIDFLTYGGGIVYLDIHNELTVVHFERNDWDENFDENHPRWMVHECRVDDTTFHFVDWEEISSSTGINETEFEKILADDAYPIGKAELLQACAQYYGWYNFNEHPVTLTKTQIRRRYGRWID